MTSKKALIFFVAGALIVWAALFGIIHGTRVLAPDDHQKDITDLRTNLETLDANIRILTDTLTKYEEELRVCRSRPLCTDPVIVEAKRLPVETMPKFETVDHSPKDEEPKP
jgi:hypothetical protein